MKIKIKILPAIILLICLILTTNLQKAYAFSEKLYIGGIAAGFCINQRGAEIVGISEVVTENGIISPAKLAEIEVGDTLLSLDGKKIDSATDIEKALNNYLSGSIIAEIVKAGGEKVIKDILPVKSINGQYKLGLFVRDYISGIGTISFFKGDKTYMALGHPVVNNGNIVEVVSGELYSCSIIGATKGEKGKAGELKGVFIKDDKLGSIDKNSTDGLLGSLEEDFDYSDLKEVEVGSAKIGSASIVSCISGVKPQVYSISLVKVDENKDSKNFVIKVTDKELLSKVGGIVQGMSGSPILQNGKIVGAVTHVFINDPTRGYGVSIQNMLNAE